MHGNPESREGAPLDAYSFHDLARMCETPAVAEAAQAIAGGLESASDKDLGAVLNAVYGTLRIHRNMKKWSPDKFIGDDDKPDAAFYEEKMGLIAREMHVLERMAALLKKEDDRRNELKREEELAPLVREYEGLSRDQLFKETIAKLEELLAVKDEKNRHYSELERGAVNEALYSKMDAVGANSIDLEKRIQVLKKLLG